ncbi:MULTISPECIES: hypothetical protein [Brucella]|uniref:Uncharacterized protein n=2 Tax=Brucella TaxID=234 RepID=A0A5C5CB46_9HYPH|nr:MULTISPECIES: hypothetical protein [Brucella]MBB4096409.1 hypothetical protein [Brucella pecoris]NKC05326.1 hypothetical protein [Brucella haematophila]TMU86170.1 hypothetical protein FGI60_25600 [Brucella haematophila]TNV08609.1 hypothetical protein FIB18_24420 [Brucella pecoris]
MVQNTIKRPPQPLYSRDLVVCQRVFDDIRSRAGVAKETEEAERMAAITVEGTAKLFDLVVSGIDEA